MGTPLQFEYTVWKLLNFSITQILREINCEESRTTTTAAFAIFVNLVSIVYILQN